MIDGLPKGPRGRIYRRIVEQLRTDPTLASVVKTWETWDRGKTQLDEVTATPALRLMPVLGSAAWFSADAMYGPLQIKVSLYLQSFDATDGLDFQDAIERAIYPYNDQTKQRAFEKALRDLGSHTGQVTFDQPASLAQAENGEYVCLGVMSVDVIRAFNP